MTSHPTFVRRQRVRTLVAVIPVVMLLGGAAACSSDSDSKSADESSSETKSESGSNEGLPDGFPDDVPLPEFVNADTIKSATDDMPGSWVLLLTIDPSLGESGESLIAAYGEQLSDAGYEVGDTGSGNVEAENERWSIDFHSSMDGTLTIGTNEK